MPSIVGQYINKQIREIETKRIFIPFAGNFALEQIAHKANPEAEIHSTDVMIYSNAIGFGLTDQDFKLEIKKQWRSDFKFLTQQTDPIDKAAVTIFFTEVSKTMNKLNVPYYAQQLDDAIANQEAYFEKIKAKMLQVKSELNFKYYGVDCMVLIDMAKKGDLFLFDPPVSDNNKDYISEYKSLQDCLEFDEVEYTMFNDELKYETLERLNKIGAYVYWRTNGSINPPEGYKEVYNYRYKWHANYCIYSNRDSNKWVGRWKPVKESVQNIKLIGKEDIITPESKIDIVSVKNEVGNHFRLMWVKKAEMLDAGKCYLIFIDGKMIGLTQLMPGLAYGTDLIVINSDPAAPTSRYKKLSKLILFLTCTEEMVKEIDDYFMWPHNGFTTRVFTNNPVSMKYRGTFKLTERSEDEGDYKYKLIYQNRKLFKTAQDGLKEWCKRYTT